MGIGGKEIHMLHRGRKRAKRLDGVETKQNIALAQQPPNGVMVNAIAGNKMARGQRNKAGFAVSCSTTSSGVISPSGRGNVAPSRPVIPRPAMDRR